MTTKDLKCLMQEAIQGILGPQITWESANSLPSSKKSRLASVNPQRESVKIL